MLLLLSFHSMKMSNCLVVNITDVSNFFMLLACLSDFDYYCSFFLKEAEDSLKAHRHQRRKTFDTLHVEELASEGERILHMTSEDHLRVNPDFNATLKTIEVLLSRVENVRTRLDELWKTKNDKLETKVKEKKFEKEANQVSRDIIWYLQLLYYGFMVGQYCGD